MLSLYLTSIKLSYLSLILFLIKLFINKNNISILGDKSKWNLLIRLIIISLIPIVNIFFAISGVYISLLMKKENFIKFMNE
jgi:hypothetical protein